MAEQVLAQCLEYAILYMSDLIELGEIGCEVGVTHKLINLRRDLFAIINTLPLTCSTFYGVATQHTAFEYILFYERIRLGISSQSFFLDGVPSNINLFVGPTSLNLPTEQVGRLKLRDVIADRLNVVGKLEAMQKGSTRKVELTTQYTAGLGADVPGPARFLVARTRAVFRGLRATKRDDLFSNCANCNCTRLFYTGELSESWSNATSVSFGSDDEDSSNSLNYWENVAGSSIDSTLPDTRRFCSRACSDQHAYHLKLMMPDFNLHMDADDVAKKSGRARVQESFKLALKRNEIAARALRTSRTKTIKNIAVSNDELELHRERRITALNVDIGLLYAASMIAESSTLSRGRILPGSFMYWRDEPQFYAKPLLEVIKIYSNMRRKEGIVSSLLTTPKFLEKIQTKAHRMF